MRKRFLLFFMAIVPLIATAHGSGTVSNLLVGRLGYQVMVKINGSVGPVSCRTQNDWHYYLDMTTPGANYILSALLTAKTSGQNIYIVSQGTCDSTGQGIELISYVMLL